MKLLIIGPKFSFQQAAHQFRMTLSQCTGYNKKPVQGEWCAMVQLSLDEKKMNFTGHWGHVNLVNEQIELVKASKDYQGITELKDIEALKEEEVALHEIKFYLKEAIEYRFIYLPYGANARLVYGQADQLSGLVVDSYVNQISILITAAGLDRFREEIKNSISEIFKQHDLTACNFYFRDQKEKRLKDGLMIWPDENSREASRVPVDLEVLEGNLNLVIPTSLQQKNGFYYDQRENRQIVNQKLTKWQGKKDHGLDLFCYAGAWGIGLLKTGVNHVDFVDQANGSEALAENLKRSSLTGKGVFHQADAFDFLRQSAKHAKRYQVLVSDPPPFVKSPDKKSEALEGYKKLHQLLFQVCDEKALLVLCSCSHYITLEEFEATALKAAKINNRTVKLLSTGEQSGDHPIRSLKDKANYLKMLVYFVS